VHPRKNIPARRLEERAGLAGGKIYQAGGKTVKNITAFPWMIGLLDCWMIGYQRHRIKIILDKLSEMPFQ
jgi:hypothetical protein